MHGGRHTVIRWTELIDEVLVCLEMDTLCDQMD